MDQQLFILLFFTGVASFVLAVSHEYFLIQNGKTWSDAQAYCQATYINLAIIESDDDMVQFQRAAQRQQFSSSAWIGLYNDINNWRWSFRNETLGNMKKWDFIQPNNLYGNQACGTISPTGWDDRNCAEKYPFVCFYEINSSYIYINTTMTWYGAQSYCRRHYTDLASERNETEFSVVHKKAANLSYYTWFGLFRDSWKWIDQTKFSTINWRPGNPNGNGDCGYLNNNQAVDDQCSSIKPFFCYSEIRKIKNAIRVKVQSNQDVNGLKAAILDQLDKKLMNNRMTKDATVTWRVQPDGMVFHKEEEDKS